MCGIAGVFHYGTPEPVADGLVEAMARALAHRGPDSEGCFHDNGIALGHRRLAIVGLNDGVQPMTSADGALTVAYNGEIYNHPALRAALEREGTVYRTASDTETLLHGYARWGDAVVERCNGMFAFALWDASRKRLLLARDRLGIKPLLYVDDGKRLIFASEMKALLLHPAVARDIDAEALDFLLTFSYIPAPWTIFRQVRKLLPAQRMVVDTAGARIDSYWNLPRPAAMVDAAEARAETRRLLRESVERHLMSDVPIGAFLSGGIDSSIITGLLRELIAGEVRTFSIGFAQYPAFDESVHARRVAAHFGTAHRELTLDRIDLAVDLPRIVERLHEPFGDSSAVAAYYVSRLARQEVKVILSGDGADELCAGYNKYTAQAWQARYRCIPALLRAGIIEPVLACLPESRGAWGNLVRKARKLARSACLDDAELHYAMMEMLPLSERAALFAPPLRAGLEADRPRRFIHALWARGEGRSPLDRSLLTDLANVLPNDMLTKVDLMSMAHSLEVRVPFLDHVFVEWMVSLDGAHKLRGTQTKAILKDAFAEMLPPEILARPKHGFELPVGEWFMGELRPLFERFYAPAAVERRGLFMPDGPRALLAMHLSRRRCLDWQLWTLLVLELWLRLYVDGVPREELLR